MSPKREVNESVACGPIRRMAARRFRGLQFHGEESTAYCRGWDVKVIKAFRMKESASLDSYEKFSGGFLFARFLFARGTAVRVSMFPWEWLDGIDTEQD